MNEATIRFYMACTFAELSGRKADQLNGRVRMGPHMPIANVLYSALPLRMGQQERQRMVDWAKETLSPGQTGEGVAPYHSVDFYTVWLEVKVWAVTNSQDEETMQAIRISYLAGHNDPDFARVVWEICDGISDQLKEVYRELMRNSPYNMTFRTA